jgi:hypothetical protein
MKRLVPNGGQPRDFRAIVRASLDGQLHTPSHLFEVAGELVKNLMGRGHSLAFAKERPAATRSWNRAALPPTKPHATTASQETKLEKFDAADSSQRVSFFRICDK